MWRQLSGLVFAFCLFLPAALSGCSGGSSEPVYLSFSVSIDENFKADSTPILVHMRPVKGGDDFYHAIWPEGASFSNESSVPVSAGEYDATIVSPPNADGSLYDFIDDIHISTSKPDDIPIALTHVDADNVNPEAVDFIIEQIRQASKKGDRSLSGGAGNHLLALADKHTNGRYQLAAAAARTPDAQGPTAVSPQPGANPPSAKPTPGLFPKKTDPYAKAIEDAKVAGKQVVEGTVRFFPTEDALCSDLGLENPYKSQWDSGPFHLVVFDSPTQVKASYSGGPGSEVNTANMIVVEPGAGFDFRANDKKRVIVAFRTDGIWWPSDASVPFGQPRGKVEIIAVK